MQQAAKYVLGAQANVWTEYMSNTQKVEYLIFPRLSALSEVLWSPKEKRNYNDFQKRLLNEFKRYDLWKVDYGKAYYDLKSTITPAKTGGILWSIESKSILPVFITNNVTNAGMKYDGPIVLNGSGNYTVSLVDRQKVLDFYESKFFI